MKQASNVTISLNKFKGQSPTFTAEQFQDYVKQNGIPYYRSIFLSELVNLNLVCHTNRTEYHWRDTAPIYIGNVETIMQNCRKITLAYKNNQPVKKHTFASDLIQSIISDLESKGYKLECGNTTLSEESKINIAKAFGYKVLKPTYVEV